MDNKEYGVKLKADISDLSEKLNKVGEIFERTKEKFKQGFQIRMTEKDLRKEAKSLQEDIKELEQRINLGDIEGTEKIQKAKHDLENWRKELQLIRDELTAIYNPFKNVNNMALSLGYRINQFGKEPFVKITKETEEMKDDIEDIGTKTNGLSGLFGKLSNDIENDMRRSVASIKRFGLSLFGIHSIWTALSRAVHAYMAYDTEANTRIQANWVALGAMFAPIVEKIVGWIQKLVAYINVFYKALTGKSFIKTALDKVKNSANGTSKAVKGLNKELANFDEITNLNFDTGVGAQDFGIADALAELEDIKLDPEIVKIIEEIADFVKREILPSLQTVWQVIKDNIVPVIVTVYNKLKEWNIPFEAVIGLVATLKYGIGVGLVTAVGMLLFKIVELYGVWEQEELQRQKTNKSYQTGLEIVKGRIETNNKLLESGTLTEEQRAKLQKENNDLSDQAEELYKNIVEENEKNGRFTKEQVKDMNKLKREIQEISGKQWDTTINLKVRTDLQKPNWYKFFEGLNEALSGSVEFLLPTWAKELFYGRKHLAKGNVAYGPTYAEFGEYAGARSNPEITAPQNIMRETMVEALQEALPTMSSKGGDTILYVNGKELARATYDDFKSEGSRIGSSNVAVRRV